MSRIFPVLFKNYPIVFQRNFILYYNDLLLEIVHFSHTAIKYYVNQFIFMYLTKKGQYWTQSTANYRTTFIQDIQKLSQWLHEFYPVWINKENMYLNVSMSIYSHYRLQVLFMGLWMQSYVCSSWGYWVAK